MREEEKQGRIKNPWISQAPVNRSKKIIRRRMRKQNHPRGKDFSIDCAGARRLVVPFIKGQLSGSELEKFLFHVDNCADCREELDIYFTFYESMDQLEQGNFQEYDFKKRLEDTLQDAHRKLYVQIVIHYIQKALLILTAVILLSTIVQEILYIEGGLEDTSLRWLMRRMNPPVETETESDIESDTEFMKDVYEKR